MDSPGNRVYRQVVDCERNPKHLRGVKHCYRTFLHGVLPNKIVVLHRTTDMFDNRRWQYAVLEALMPVREWQRFT